MGGHPLVQVEDLIRLGTAEAPLPVERLEPLPLVTVRGDICVDIHLLNLTDYPSGMADKGSEPGAATSASTSAATGPTNDATWVPTDDLVTGEAVALELPPPRSAPGSARAWSTCSSVPSLSCSSGRSGPRA